MRALARAAISAMSSPIVKNDATNAPMVVTPSSGICAAEMADEMIDVKHARRERECSAVSTMANLLGRRSRAIWAG